MSPHPRMNRAIPPTAIASILVVMSGDARPCDLVHDFERADDRSMNDRAFPRLGTLILVAAALLVAAPALAETAVVVREGAEVRSAPFRRAPVLSRLQLSTNVTVDDQPANGWRRVQLPSGTFGFVLDEALRVGGPASPPAPAPDPDPAPESAEPAAPPEPPPVLVAARVNVFELT